MSVETIRELQDEVKVLKNEIKQALLDIREYLLTSPQPPVPGVEPSSKGEASVAQRQEPALPAEPERELSWGLDRRKRPPLEEASPNYSLDLLAIAALSQWVGRTMDSIGEEQTKAVIEVYEMMERLSPPLKETLLRFTCLNNGGESPGRKALLELDDLLSRGRSTNGKNRATLLSLLSQR